MAVWTKNTKFIAFYKFYQRLANSNTTLKEGRKEALNCTASIAADSIVDVIIFITGVLFCDPKTSSSQSRIWVPKPGQVWLRLDLKKSNPVQPYSLHWKKEEKLLWLEPVSVMNNKGTLR